jgi:hypothetical protein
VYLLRLNGARANAPASGENFCEIPKKKLAFIEFMCYS